MVYRTKSFQAAANVLHTTQPAVSQRIKELERVVGVDLFERDARSIRLALAGRKMLPYAERMVTLADEISGALLERHAVTGLIKIGSTDTVALTWLPRLLERLRDEYPRLEVELQIGISVDLMEALKKREIDIALVASPIGQPTITSVELGRLQNCWMAAPNIIDKIIESSPKEISKIPVFTYARGSHQYELISKWFESNGVDRVRFNICTSLSTIIKLTIEGLGISILSPEMMVDEIKAGNLEIIHCDPSLPSLPFAAAYIHDRMPQLLHRLAAFAAESAAEDRTFGAGGSQSMSISDT